MGPEKVEENSFGRNRKGQVTRMRGGFKNFGDGYFGKDFRLSAHYISKRNLALTLIKEKKERGRRKAELIKEKGKKKKDWFTDHIPLKRFPGRSGTSRAQGHGPYA